MRIDVSLRLSLDETTVARGTVTLNRRIRFIVQLREREVEGIKRLMVVLPRQQVNGFWTDLIRTEKKQEIEAAILEEFHFMLTRDMEGEVPEVSVEALHMLLPKQEHKVKILAVARISIDQVLEIDGIQIKRYGKDYIINMPQYKGSTGYQDVIYATDPTLQQKIKATVLKAYQEEVRLQTYPFDEEA